MECMIMSFLVVDAELNYIVAESYLGGYEYI